jgi:aryl-alcohol dehydrogenase-like predicted oxidoreductase
MTPANHEQVDRLAKLAAEAGLSLVQLALAWVLRDDCVAAAIIGATTPEQVRENVAASGIRLDEDFLYRVEMVLSAS